MLGDSGIFLCRKLAKKVQTELAEANSVAEEVLASMTTVKAHAAEDSAHAAYCFRLKKFYSLQVTVSQQAMCTRNSLRIYNQPRAEIFLIYMK